MKFRVRIFNRSNPQQQQEIEIEQADRTNLAFSPEILEGWAFQHTEEIK